MMDIAYGQASDKCVFGPLLLPPTNPSSSLLSYKDAIFDMNKGGISLASEGSLHRCLKDRPGPRNPLAEYFGRSGKSLHDEGSSGEQSRRESGNKTGSPQGCAKKGALCSDTQSGCRLPVSLLVDLDLVMVALVNVVIVVVRWQHRRSPVEQAAVHSTRLAPPITVAPPHWEGKANTELPTSLEA
ncbi:hypothetical protein MGYG_05215 [Nannizzia gypsea CBS 118893]|uniref:Uncharacterized protein n=1 Tax=Arthroderma gypseum (strain ATCC MYA-4604 / CBS 118893) TaxID=535722 RepID=E4UV85_ARTGP|nr:hypothetical protein MGYG_05215 [Nannizzia gypsea CBS 118893]EFR02212.1 hypothetical protein MGYG_05215 [Nannizzia gypsea CBS 118893]